jgi:hypothetical protein
LPFMLVTAASHWPSVVAPCDWGLYCRVFIPTPARRRALPQSTLQLRQVHIRLCGAVFRSSPSTWPTSMVWAAPHKQHRFSPGGRQALVFAR